MTARVSCSSPSGPHMWPEVRIIAGIDASTITSLGTCRLVIPRFESTIASSGPSASPCSIAALISAPDSMPSRPARMLPRPLFGLRPGGGDRIPVPVEHLGQEGAHHMPEDDRVGDLHHRRLQMDREQHAVGLGPGDLSVQELVQRGHMQGGGVDHLTGQHRHRLPQHRRRAVVGDQRDPQRPGPIHHRRRLARAEVVGGHVRDVGLRVRRPGAHRVRMVPRVLLHRRRRPAVGVPLPQHRIDRTALDLVVAGRGRPSPRRWSGCRGSPAGRSPCPASSATAAFNCGTDAEMFGNLMMFASGVFANAPSSASASAWR